MKGFFGVITKPQTYLNMLYLLFSFPLGVAYFTILVAGLATGFGLIITLLGIPLLIGMLFVWWTLAALERELANVFFKAKIKYKPSKVLETKGAWNMLKKHISEPYTWTSLIYLFIKFPMGIISFVALVTLLSVSASFILMPFVFYLAEIGLLQANFCISGVCLITGYVHTLFFTIIGLLLLFVSLHVFNGIAYLHKVFAESMLVRK